MPPELADRVLNTRQLKAAGWSKWQIERAVAAGELKRVRPGWFSGLIPDAAVVAAVQAGGCVSCFSALQLLGVWVPEGKRRHVRLPEHRRPPVRKAKAAAGAPDGTAARQRSRGSCRPFGVEPAVTSAIDGLEPAFRCALRCGSREDVVVVADSILHSQLATREELEEWAKDAPRAVRALLDVADGKAESGSESMVRWRLRALRLSPRIQVRVMRGVRVDVLVGERLIIEIDSRAHHTSVEAYESDRRRDRRLLARGFLVLRLSYRQIHDEWPEIEQAILQIVRRGDHRWARRRTAA